MTQPSHLDAPVGLPPTETEAWWAGLEEEASTSELNGAASASTLERLPLATCALDAPDPAPIEWGIDGFWTKGDYGLLVGDDGSFKSACALHIAAAVAGGYPVFGRFPTERAPVLIVSAEDPANVVQLRLEAFVRGHEWDRRRVMENVHYIATPDATLSEGRWQFHLVGECSRIEPRLIVFDPLAELLAGDENSNNDARPLLKYLRRLGAEHDAMTMVVHHFGKAAPDKSIRDKIRGASAFLRASRVTYAFEFLSDGVAVQCLKLSRAPKLEPFLVKREVHSESSNRAMWTWARLTYADPKQAAQDRGETFILTQLRAVSDNPTTADLRSMAQGTGVSVDDITKGLRTLQAKGLIFYVAGARGAKKWGLTPPPDEPPAIARDPR